MALWGGRPRPLTGALAGPPAEGRQEAASSTERPAGTGALL
jgi:hypothetical protein